MPNWVFNTLKVSGDKELVREFAERADSNGSAFFRNFVQPEDAEAYEQNWYNWNIENWGCKWDASDFFGGLNEEGDEVLHYEFSTPWSPPERFFYKVVAMYPKLDFQLYYNEEQGWGGEVHGSGGTWWVVDEWEIPETHEDAVMRHGFCFCDENDEVEYMHDDCPKKMEVEKV